MIRWIMPVPMLRAALRDLRTDALLHMIMVVGDNVCQVGGGKRAIERRQRKRGQ